jgi:osomolarity two-component system response regulator SSK1
VPMALYPMASPTANYGHSKSSSQSNVKHARRVWVKRPGMQATTVYVGETDIVDDLKLLILQKYPTSLARTCDPSDLQIELVYEEAVPGPSKSPDKMDRAAKRKPSTNGPVRPPLSAGSSAENRQSLAGTPLTIDLAPDESVFGFLDQYFPHGMTMADALIVSPSPGNWSASAPPASGSPQLPRIAMQKSPTPESASEDNTPGDNGSPMTVQRPSLRSKVAAAAGASGSTNNTNNNNSSRGALPREKSNGVLLLPRQFKLPSSSSKNELEEKKKKPPKPPKQRFEVEVQPGEVPVTEIEPEAVTSLEPSHEDVVRPENNIEPAAVSRKETLASSKDNGTGKIRKVQSLSFPTLEGVVPQINVLIVEDNVINQKILEAFMRRKKIRCAVAKNGKEAVEKWRQGGFHLVLMDIQLPVMSGIEATKEIRRLEQDNRVGTFSSDKSEKLPVAKKEDRVDTKLFKSPVIIVALTASSSSADKSEALAAGCNDFLTKPVNLIWLEQKTIEWGCMQALIDFEGWKHWVPRDDRTKTSTKAVLLRNRTRSQSRGATPTTRTKSQQGRQSNPNAPKRLQPILLTVPNIVPPPAIVSPAARDEEGAASESSTDSTTPTPSSGRGRTPVKEVA